MTEQPRSVLRRLQDLDDRVLGPQGRPPGWSRRRYWLASRYAWPRWFYGVWAVAVVVLLLVRDAELEWLTGVVLIAATACLFVATAVADRQRRLRWHRSVRDDADGG